MQLDGRMSEVVVLSKQEQLKRIKLIQEDIDQLGKRLAEVLRQNQQMLAIAGIPGIGPLTDTALVASIGDISIFKTARQFASWLCLTPRQTGTGGKTSQHGISKRCDSYVRTLIEAGVRAVIARSGWVDRPLHRRHANVVVVALANKMARAAWAVLTKGHAFDPCRWSPVEPAMV
ncbi:MAG TPA: transposase [Hydrogenophaga sp.]